MLTKKAGFTFCNIDFHLDILRSLYQLTAECVDVLATPKKEHKRHTRSPGLMSATKTPQSILKVRRLSKVLIPGIGRFEIFFDFNIILNVDYFKIH